MLRREGKEGKRLLALEVKRRRGGLFGVSRFQADEGVGPFCFLSRDVASHVEREEEVIQS